LKRREAGFSYSEQNTNGSSAAAIHNPRGAPGAAKTETLGASELQPA
jgi:hypothetical protein